MKNDFVYLKRNVVPEPLFDQWYAWPHLISPATAAMNILGRHIKIMNSYILAPQIHAEAVKDPKLLGGPFMDYDGNRKEEVKQLKEATLTNNSRLIEFAKAVQQLCRLLKTEATGASMQELYEKVPDILKGYVELFYDVNNQPSFRFFESLLYKSEFYKPELQSISFYLLEDDDRPFILSTPRLETTTDTVHVRMPFNSPVLDELFRMQREPNSYSYIKEKMGIREEDDALFRTFFTTDAPEVYAKYEGDYIRTRYFGHACILIESKNVSILSDPVISYGYNSHISRFTYSDLPDVIDYVVITHNHQDHILIETMIQLRHKIRYIIVPRNGTGALQDPSVKMMLNKLGFHNVIEIDELDTVEMPGCTITGLPFLGEHSDLDIRTKMCHHVRLDNELSILLAADSCNHEPKVYEHIQQVIGDIDVLFLGMECDGAPLSWLYGPLLPEALPKEKDHSRRLRGSNFKEGIDLVYRFKPKDVYVYAMGQEPWLNYIMSLKYTEESSPIIASNKLLQVCREMQINAERLFGEKEIVYKKEASILSV
ncbi:MAG TPA: MBL fold metallo-hydrolase [Chitinophaga sp.]|uniref:MBL fold metallo-hydrolase n=1 Tax=Chitinophaga sp. TaxID=1869181 RepID=UPI002F95D2A3